SADLPGVRLLRDLDTAFVVLPRVRGLPELHADTRARLPRVLELRALRIGGHGAREALLGEPDVALLLEADAEAVMPHAEARLGHRIAERRDPCVELAVEHLRPAEVPPREVGMDVGRVLRERLEDLDGLLVLLLVDEDL